MLRIKKRLNKLLAKSTGNSEKEIEADKDRYNLMFPKEAIEYGIIDKIIEE